MTRVLITGGAGYIGSHTAKLLQAAGFEPYILDNLCTGNRWAIANYRFFEADLSDEDYTFDILSQIRVSAIIHFAASAYVGESVSDPSKYFENNVNNGLKLLNAARRASIKVIIFSSSCATYGIPEHLPITEDHVQVPVNPYGDSKLFFEKALRWYREAYGIQSVVLRYFNAAGADPGGELGECHTPETHLIPGAIEAALGQRPALELFGTDFATADGTAIRDFVHVTDLADAHLLALEYLLAAGESCAVNLGSGQGVSVLQAIDAVQRIAHRNVPVHHRPRRPGDPMSLTADNSKARTLLGWRPVHSDFEYIVKTAWRWHNTGLHCRMPLPGNLRYSTAVASAI